MERLTIKTNTTNTAAMKRLLAKDKTGRANPNLLGNELIAEAIDKRTNKKKKK